MEKVRCYARRKRGMVATAVVEQADVLPQHSARPRNGEVQSHQVPEQVLLEQQEQFQQHVLLKQPRDAEEQLDTLQQDLPVEVEAVEDQGTEAPATSEHRPSDLTGGVRLNASHARVEFEDHQDFEQLVEEQEESAGNIGLAVDSTERWRFHETLQVGTLIAAPAAVCLSMHESMEYQERILNHADVIWQKFEVRILCKDLCCRTPAT